MAAKRPILCIGPIGGDADKILQEVNGGLLSDWDDAVKLEQNIMYFYAKHKQGNLPCESKGIEKYSRKELTKDMAKLLNTITS
jgi:hypothetical protein